MTKAALIAVRVSGNLTWLMARKGSTFSMIPMYLLPISEVVVPRRQRGIRFFCGGLTSFTMVVESSILFCVVSSSYASVMWFTVELGKSTEAMSIFWLIDESDRDISKYTPSNVRRISVIFDLYKLFSRVLSRRRWWRSWSSLWNAAERWIALAL